MSRRVLTVALIGLGILWACNEHDPHPPSVTDPGKSAGTSGGAGGGSSSGGTGDGGLGDAATTTDAGAVCTDLDTPTTIVDENGVPSDVPVGTGGNIVDSTYDLQTAERFVGVSTPGGPTGVTFRETIRISGGGTLLERVRIQQLNNGPETDTNASYTLQQNGTNIVLTQTCPFQSAAEPFSFTSADGRLTLISQTGESFTYAGRP